MRIALVGTRGVPARYGGFETCVEEVGRRLVKAGHEVVVYCRALEVGESAVPAAVAAPELDAPENPRAGSDSMYEGMELVHLPAVTRKALETLSHTALSVKHIRRHPVDVAIVFNAANSPFVPALRAAGIPVATHVDGLEWKRSKWRGAGSTYYRLAESMAVRWSDALIADAQGIADYYQWEFGAETEQIAYGAPIVSDERHEHLHRVGVQPGAYHLVVARFEPENHVDVIVDGYRRSSARLPLLVVGSAPYSDAYTASVHALADDRVSFVGGVWDQDLLDQLYANCATYLHGHSVGGTNPSLLRAIGAAASTIAFDVGFNREVLGDTGRYFRDADSIAAQIEDAEQFPDETAERGRQAQHIAYRYDWDDVAGKYEQLCERLVATGVRSRRSTGRASGRRKQVARGAYRDDKRAADKLAADKQAADEQAVGVLAADTPGSDVQPSVGPPQWRA